MADTTNAFHRMLVLAIIKNSDELHRKAQEFAVANQIDNATIIKVCKNIERWFRLFGGKKLYPNELSAIIQIQAFFRMCLVQQNLRKELQFYKRLSVIDSTHHMQHALTLHNILHLKSQLHSK